jgi:hypothetical protein
MHAGALSQLLLGESPMVPPMPHGFAKALLNAFHVFKTQRRFLVAATLEHRKQGSLIHTQQRGDSFTESENFLKRFCRTNRHGILEKITVSAKRLVRRSKKISKFFIPPGIFLPHHALTPVAAF